MMMLKRFLIELIKLVLHLFFLFPMKKNTVLFSAYSGKQYSCNPKYIYEQLKKKAPDAKIIWAFCEPEKFTDTLPDIKLIRFKSIQYLYYVLTAVVVVDNVEGWSILPKRKGQTVINTWHGGGAYKGVGLRREDTTESENKNMLEKHKRVSLYLSSSHAFSQLTIREAFGYKGKILECGMPRNDILLNRSEDLAKAARRKLSIVDDQKIVLFAPTFRHDTQYSNPMDCGAVLKALQERFSGNWVMLYRAHYYVERDKKEGSSIINVSDYPDMQELLLLSDVLITDYSSSIWDFSLMYKPGFLFMPDLDQYANERDFFTPVETWPYPAVTTMPNLLKQIVSYNQKKSEEKIRLHHEMLGICESGNASEQTIEFIMERMN